MSKFSLKARFSILLMLGLQVDLSMAEAPSQLPTCKISLAVEKKSSVDQVKEMSAKDYSTTYLCGLSSPSSKQTAECKSALTTKIKEAILNKDLDKTEENLFFRIKKYSPALHRKLVGKSLNQISKIVASEFFSRQKVKVHLQEESVEAYEHSGDFKFTKIQDRFRLIPIGSEEGLKIQANQDDLQFYRVVKIDGQDFFEVVYLNGFHLGQPEHWEKAIQSVPGGMAAYASNLAVMGTSGGQFHLLKNKKYELRLRVLLVTAKDQEAPTVVFQVLQGNLTGGKIELATLVDQFAVSSKNPELRSLLNFTQTDATIKVADLRISCSQEKSPTAL